MEGQVIGKLAPIVATPAGDVDANGFKLTDVTAYNTASSNLTTAQATYTTTINNPASTSADIAVAAGDLALKEQAYSAAVSNLYANYSPITDTAKDALMGTILNGSWERDAIKSNTEGLATEVDARATADTTLQTNIDAEKAARIADVDAEEARATAAEGVLDGKITTEKNDRIADVNAEEARATAAEGALDGKITAETTRATAAEGVLDGKITTEKNDRIADVNAEETRAIAAEGVLDGKITAEQSQRQAADATLTTNLATEKTERQAADATIDTKLTNYQTAQSALIRKGANGQIHIGENSLITQEIGGVQKLFAQDGAGKAINIDVSNGSDLLVNGVSVATDDDISAIRSDYQAADRNLRNDIDTNTRGIAMVAAMTNTTIRDGMTQGVDFNISQFEGETGFAFGYAHKINENMQLHGAAASTTDFDESVGRLGVSFQW